MPFAIPAAPIHVSTDLARYSPGQVVHLSVQGSRSRGTLRLRVFHNVEEIASGMPKTSWHGSSKLDWHPPKTDGRGYLIVAEIVDGTRIVARGSCGVDVSSTWTRFPRYGYLAHFEADLKDRAPSILALLNDYHLNSLQFYDWQWRHHRPLSPNPQWPDIANRLNSAETVRAFIRASHARGIACMAYNLGYGAVDGYQDDGVSQSWALYEDPGAAKPYKLTLPKGWATTGLYLQDMGNPGWQAYLIRRESEALRAFDFDGWHMDQLGDPGLKFTATGRPTRLEESMRPFFDRVKREMHGKLIFNNVGAYGLEETRASRVDAMYVEPWEWNGQRTYDDLRRTIEAMRSTGKEAVLAAYMDYDLAKKSPGSPFNPHGVLLASATILASGGSHLQIGDDLAMLCHEYFPNRDLRPGKPLLTRLRTYYDFLVAYENLLRGDIEPDERRVEIEGLPVTFSGEPGKVWAICRRAGKKTIVHLINLLSAGDDEWRDRDGTRAEPRVVMGLRVRIPGSRHPKATVASPDDGLAIPAPAQTRNGWVVVPRLEYWTTVVVED